MNLFYFIVSHVSYDSYNLYVIPAVDILVTSLKIDTILYELGKPLPQLLWWLDGQVIDDTFATTSENTVRNDLLITKLSRRDLNKTLTCQAFNSNLTQSMSTSVSIDLFCK